MFSPACTRQTTAFAVIALAFAIGAFADSLAFIIAVFVVTLAFTIVNQTKSKIIFKLVCRHEKTKFKEAFTKANTVWSRAFNKTYVNDYPGDAVIIGCTSDGKPVFCAIVDYNNEGQQINVWGKVIILRKKEQALITSIASYPQNNGYGTSLMKYIINHLKVKKVNINIDNENDNSDRLVNFYSQFGFETEDSDNEDHSVFEYDTRFEFRMVRTSKRQIHNSIYSLYFSL